jgi:hypothetical protein
LDRLVLEQHKLLPRPAQSTSVSGKLAPRSKRSSR